MDTLTCPQPRPQPLTSSTSRVSGIVCCRRPSHSSCWTFWSRMVRRRRSSRALTDGLIDAAGEGDLGSVRRLLRRGANVDGRRTEVHSTLRLIDGSLPPERLVGSHGGGSGRAHRGDAAAAAERSTHRFRRQGGLDSGLRLSHDNVLPSTRTAR